MQMILTYSAWVVEPNLVPLEKKPAFVIAGPPLQYQYSTKCLKCEIRLSYQIAACYIWIYSSYNPSQRRSKDESSTNQHPNH